MKKLLTLIAILTLLTLPALSEAAQNIVLDAPMDADLNGDGAMETVTWTYAPDEEGEDWLCLEIKDENGASAMYRTDISQDEAMWLADFDGPALVVTGRGQELQDLSTFVLRYTPRGRIEEVMFNADGRELVSDEYYTPAGYGLLHGMSAGAISLECYIDVLGTWSARRDYVLNENGRFVFKGEMWFSTLDTGDPETWESTPVLTCAREIEYIDDSGERQTLQSGTRLLITLTDRASAARFVTQDGDAGTLIIYPGYASDDFLFAVNGISENELFTFVPYEG